MLKVQTFRLAQEGAHTMLDLEPIRKRAEEILQAGELMVYGEPEQLDEWWDRVIPTQERILKGDELALAIAHRVCEQAARKDIPTLIAEVERLRDRVDNLEDEIADLV